MINTASCTLQRSPTKFSRRKAEPIPAAASHGSAHYLLAALAVVMLATTLSVVPIPSEVPLVGNLVDSAMADHQQRCTTVTVTKYHPTIGHYTSTQRSCTTIDHPKAPSNLEKAAVAVLGYALGAAVCRSHVCAASFAGATALVNEPKPYVRPQTGPPCLPGCSTSQSSSGTSSGSRSSGSGHPSGGTG